jgi:HK97 family phage prohead protease
MPLDGYARTTAPRRVKFLGGVSDRQVRVVASDGTTDRMGDILDPAGCQLANFRRNPIVLAQHNSEEPIARCPSITANDVQVTALIEFPAAGVNVRSDEYLALLKSGVLGAVSVGFLPLARSPLQGGGWRYTAWELLELSVVSIPANANALVQERSLVTNLGARRVARDLARAAVIAARHPPDREANLERVRRIRARLGMTPLASDAERHAAEEELRRRDRAAAIDGMMRMANQW